MISKHRLNGQSVLLAKTSVTSKLLYFAKVAFESETLSKVQLTHRILYFQKPILKVTFEKKFRTGIFLKSYFQTVVIVRGLGGSAPLLSFEPPCNSMSPPD